LPVVSPEDFVKTIVAVIPNVADISRIIRGIRRIIFGGGKRAAFGWVSLVTGKDTNELLK
jgi:hypothetical protein